MVNGRDVHYPTYESNLTHVESLSQEKTRPQIFKLAHKFDTKFCPPRRPHKTTYIQVQLLLKALGLDLMKSE